jgi:tryptophan 7-halogenase
MHGPIEQVVIVGGGTAGWMAAAALSRVLQGRVAVRLVESDEIGTVGVGEATIPLIKQFNEVIGADENEFLRATQGTFKLGIQFVNWCRLGHRYMHGFGGFGPPLRSVRFEDHWHRLHRQGRADDLDAYSINHQAALQARFMRPTREYGASPLAEMAYAFHFDAHLYAKYLRRMAEDRGVRRIEGKIVEVRREPVRGHVQSVVTDKGAVIDGELFIDCSGFRGLLIEQALATGYDDWSHWLPCDRAVAVPCASAPELLPYTRATAHGAGWQWRIPLQHRIGNGHVFCSRFMSEDEATSILMNNLDGRALAEPRTLHFATGRRKKAWNGNVVALGLAAGFMEPLESTSIHLVQTGIGRLFNLFPDKTFAPAQVDEYNRQSQFEWERIRDFLVLHYCQTERDDTPFWRWCRDIDIPATLRRKMDLYRVNGRVVREVDELFTEISWLQVMHGQGLAADAHYALVDMVDELTAAEHMHAARDVIARCVPFIPKHAEYIAQHCTASPVG